MVNGTPYNFTMTGIHSYQMEPNSDDQDHDDTFDWSSQWGDVPAGGSIQNNIFFQTDDTPTGKPPPRRRSISNLARRFSQGDDAGEVYYSIQGTSKTFSIRALVDSSQQPKWRMHVVFDGWSPEDISQQDYYFPFPPNGNLAGNQIQLSLTGSESFGYQTNQNPPVAWMHSILDVIGDRKLKYITIPGSHDAGMSDLNGKTSGSTHDNTQTQVLNVYNQAVRGSRWFDMRPCIGNGGQYRLCHYSNVDGYSQGANGQLLADAMQNLTA
jgi:hypothetical protein